ncbi:SH3 domain-containing protein 19 ADAM-binding protein [Collichthys lucidus]|uniref:SH3 domain-containing protein 19 ADAM-binding protein n=1 Tax=Collichthys lucidus TaxID=240159 RepID=A0A4U5U2N6_COLLU|nr:SH3 domain-containing protein 19 ADAM-binding protein [Collichthys lucidus]
MAEARREEEEEGQRRDLRNRNQTTAKTNSQSEHTRERRRPEITIVSAEPLANNNWFPGTTVVFPPPPQSGWSAGIQAVSQPPPSYDQVIQEKTQEERIVKPTAAPRRTTCTSTSGTQTDPVRGDTSATVKQTARKRPAGKKPQKPPRPSPPKPLDRDPVTETVASTDERVGTVRTNTEGPSETKSDTQNKVSGPFLFLGQNPESRQSQEEVKVQTLVKIDNECEENIVNQSDEALQDEDAGSEMNGSHSQRNIRARIQAFESQTSTEDGNVVEAPKPEPRPRKATNKPPAPRPEPPKKPVGLSIKEELEILHNKAASSDRPRPVLTRAKTVYDEEVSPVPPVPPVKPPKEPLKPNMNINNHNSASMHRENKDVDGLSNHIPVKPQQSVDSNGGSFSRQSIARRPTTIRVPSKTGSYNFLDSPPPLPAQKPVGHLNTSANHKQSPTSTFQEFAPEPSLPPRRLSTSKPLPPRPPPAKTGPGRPPPPNLQATGRSQSASWEVSPRLQAQKPHRKGPVLPPRPNPGHHLYNKYTLQLSHGIASYDYNGSNTGELSFQKNEVLLLLEEIDHNTFECQVGDTRGRVDKSRMKVITPLASVSHMSRPQGAGPAGSGGAGSGLKVQAVHDFSPEGPGELGLRAGDVVTMVEQVDMVPRCVARFDFEGEHTDELSFSEGDVIQLKEFVGQDWARGQIGNLNGIFPLNFVEIIEDLPPPPSPSQQQTQSTRLALPGMVASPNTHPEVAKPAQASQSSVEWVVALYDFTGSSDSDLSFQQGDRILISKHIDAEWSCGRLNGREGIFPSAFVESSTGQQSNNQYKAAAAAGSRARSLYDYASDCDEELSLKVGDIITNLEVNR